MTPADAPPFVVPDPTSTLVFLAIVLFVVVAGVAGLPPRWRWQGAAAAGVWLVGTAGLSLSGILTVVPMALLILLIPTAGLSVVLAVSPAGARLADRPIWALVGFHAFRLPLEIVLHRWHAVGTLPIQMTWSGANLDVITGISAVLVGAAAARWTLPRSILWTFEVVGLALLLNVIRIAATSSPTPLRRYLHDPPVLLLYHVPYVWIVSVCVAGALVGHLVLWRRLGRSA